MSNISIVKHIYLSNGVQITSDIHHKAYNVLDSEGKIIMYFYMGSILSCCGSALLSSMEYTEYLSLKQKQELISNNKEVLFEAIKKIALDDFGVTNITYYDTPDGIINSWLGKEFELVHSYRNNNSSNVVELRVFDFEYEGDEEDENY